MTHSEFKEWYAKLVRMPVYNNSIIMNKRKNDKYRRIVDNVRMIAGDYFIYYDYHMRLRNAEKRKEIELLPKHAKLIERFDKELKEL